MIGAVSKAAPIPLIASGGVGSTEHLADGLVHGADAVAVADVLHYNRLTIGELREAAARCRPVGAENPGAIGLSEVARVVDFGAGNLYSVSRAVEKVGYLATVTDSPDAIRGADRLILPGVGAFRDGMVASRAAGSMRRFANSEHRAGRSWASALACRCS